ncbi:MAG TPA: hypothetical protein EYP59_03440 [Thiotrichaceae bacterium]|nr:hypothetical protein [Thiotrichaceae bacterium]
MNWHVITSSKGGIGKTLLALLLLAHHLEDDEKKQQGSTLVVDLNGMNADSAAIAILLYQAKIDPSVFCPLKSYAENEENGRHLGKQLIFQKTFSLSDNQSRDYVVAYPNNPYEPYDHNRFADLLYTIKMSALEMADKLDIAPLEHVIIDTHYHFCNIFGQQGAHYKIYEQLFKNDNIIVWFLWVYRQLDKLFNSNEHEVVVFKQTAKAIEDFFKSHTNPAPLRHVFNPGALVTSPPEEVNRGVLNAIVGGLFNLIATENQKDYTFDELEESINQLPAGNDINFGEFNKILTMAYPRDERFNGDPYFLLLDILLGVINIWNKDKSSKERPMNIIPLSVYQHGLQYYTDKKRIDPVSRLKKFNIYNNFKKLMV